MFDLAALRSVLTDLQARRVRVVAVDTRTASPFAQSLLLGWVAVYMYEGDAPLAERRAAALSLDRDLLRELLGGDGLRELLDGDAVAQVELELARLAPTSRRGRHPDDVHDLLVELGDLSVEELAARVDGAPGPLVDGLVRDRRVIRITVAGEPRVVAAEDAARYRDALGATVPVGLPAVFTAPVEDPLGDLLRRYARTHGPFTTVEATRRFGLPTGETAETLERLEQTGRLVHGELRPGGSGREWCDVDVLRRLRRRSLAALRAEIEPVDADVLARFGLAWHGITSRRRGLDALVDAISQLQGAPIPASVLERDVLSARVEDYRPSMLDELCASGDIVWIGDGALGSTDGRVVLAFRDQAALLAPAPPPEPPTGPLADAVRAHLRGHGASFWPELARAVGAADERTLLDVLWDLVWAGEATNDGLAALRARLGGRARPPAARPTRAGSAGSDRPPPPAAGRSSTRSPAPRRARRSGRWPAPGSCSSATASSPVKRCAPKGPPAASPRCTRPCARWRRPARCGAATSSPGSAPPSSRSRVLRTASAPNASPRRPRPCSPRPTRRNRTVRPSPGLIPRAVPLAARARSSCCAPVGRSASSSGARSTSSPSARTPTSGSSR